MTDNRPPLAVWNIDGELGASLSDVTARALLAAAVTKPGEAGKPTRLRITNGAGDLHFLRGMIAMATALSKDGGVLAEAVAPVAAELQKIVDALQRPPVVIVSEISAATAAEPQTAYEAPVAESPTDAPKTELPRNNSENALIRYRAYAEKNGGLGNPWPALTEDDFISRGAGLWDATFEMIGSQFTATVDLHTSGVTIAKAGRIDPPQRAPAPDFSDSATDALR